MARSKASHRGVGGSKKRHPAGESARGTSRPNGISSSEPLSPNERAENAPRPSRTSEPGVDDAVHQKHYGPLRRMPSAVYAAQPPTARLKFPARRCGGTPQREEPGAAPDRGRITGSRDTTSHRRPRQVSLVVEKTKLPPRIGISSSHSPGLTTPSRASSSTRRHRKRRFRRETAWA